MDELKRPNTKGLISRRFRQSEVELKIINTNTDEQRTKRVELVDKGDPVRSACEKARLQPGEMIYRKTLIADRYVVVVMTPEEFLYRGRILEYIPYTSTQRKDSEQ